MNAVNHVPEFDRSQKTIVVVEDVADLAEVLVLLLESEGYTARAALSGKTGLAFVAELKPDAVLLDYMLPDMTGAEVGIQLRSMPDMRDLKILMYTSTPEAVVKPNFEAYDAYLVKPVLHDRLVRTLDAALDPGSSSSVDLRPNRSSGQPNADVHVADSVPSGKS